MTRKISGSTIALLLFVSVNVMPAHANGSPQWVTGEVVSIVEKQDKGLISLKLADGELYSVSSGASLLEGVEIGDVVTVQVIEGWARIITIAKDRKPETPKPEKKDSGVEWIPGEVVFIQLGATDSLVSVKMSDKTVFNIASSNDKLSGIKVGDHVIVKVYQGWAQSVTKK
ncbi:MAG: hypothetical protein ACREOP_04365 [Thermodesulfobacteriota bacterium]